MQEQRVSVREGSKQALSAENRNRIVRRLMRDHAMEESYACALFRETLTFLEVCALWPNLRFAPSKEVDKGWHVFLMYTRAYRTFCHVRFGRYVDHEPSDAASCSPSSGVDIVAFMKERGIRFDERFWMRASASCSADDCTATDCYQGDDD